MEDSVFGYRWKFTGTYWEERSKRVPLPDKQKDASEERREQKEEIET